MKITVAGKSFNVPPSWSGMSLYARQNYLRDTHQMKAWMVANAASRIAAREGKKPPYIPDQLQSFPDPWWKKL